MLSEECCAQNLTLHYSGVVLKEPVIFRKWVLLVDVLRRKKKWTIVCERASSYLRSKPWNFIFLKKLSKKRKEEKEKHVSQLINRCTNVTLSTTFPQWFFKFVRLLLSLTQKISSKRTRDYMRHCWQGIFKEINAKYTINNFHACSIVAGPTSNWRTFS